MQVDEEKCEIAVLKAQILRLERQLAASKMVSQPPHAEQSPQSPAPGPSSQLPPSKSSSQPRVPEPSQLSSERRK